MNKLTRFVGRLCYLISLPFMQIFYSALNTPRNYVHNIGTLIDRLIPFNKVFIIPYVFWYVYVFATLLFFAAADYRSYFRLLFGILTGMAVCFIIYYIFPTTVPRPEVYGNDILSGMVRKIYFNDNPFNCFPSIHILDTFLVSAYLWKYDKSRVLRFFIILSSVSIYMSTLFVKQHYLLDAVSATLLGMMLYFVFNSDHIWSKFRYKPKLGTTA